jgi:hypothetical protein
MDSNHEGNYSPNPPLALPIDPFPVNKVLVQEKPAPQPSEPPTEQH